MLDQQLWFEGIKTFGLPTIMLVVACIYLGKFVDRVMKQNEIREARLTDLVQQDVLGLQKSIEDHDKRSAAAISAIMEANKYNRLEHESMMINQKETSLILRQIAQKLNINITV